ncbi:MAG: 3-dehydro-4-phosphotetronate decarboxylase [Pseudonocardiales bacterium]|nr:3-dehydro-4-phosphotetronate decarboxylase [Pseudonocardiales bacterium]
MRSAELLVQVARDLFLRGLTPGTTGNLSIRVGDGTILISPTNSCLGYLVHDRLSQIDRSGTTIKSSPQPSKELPLHRFFYSDPDVRAVVHLHSPWASALSCLAQDPREDLARFTPYFAMKVAPLGLVPYFEPGDMTGADLLREHASNHRAALLRNHGTIGAAGTLLEALNIAEEIEHSARMWFTLQGHGTRLLSATAPGLRPEYSNPTTS